MEAPQKRNWIPWLVIGIATILLVAIAYFILKPTPADTNPPEIQEQQPKQSSTNDLTLLKALESLANQYQVNITLDNPFLDDCPVEEALISEQSFKKTLQNLSRQYQIEVHESAPGEYLLIGGTCN